MLHVLYAHVVMCCNVSTHLRNKYNCIILSSIVPLGRKWVEYGHLGHILSWPSGSHPLTRTKCDPNVHTQKRQLNKQVAVYKFLIRNWHFKRLSFYTGGH